ncbi:hypothetical protein FJTKL_10145 [Diaporthe vaccinii]|uniref:Uncharacterized protein n=1 Tax=Diaporthe vaccinii TaxID=105482 RepID=A0ABR4EKP7_9PEZI
MAARKDGLGQAFAQGNFELDQAVLDALPSPGTEVISAHAYGQWVWAKQAKILCRLSNGETVTYFLKVTTGESDREMTEGQFEADKALHAVSPSFCPRPIAWAKYKSTPGPDSYFLLAEFREYDAAIVCGHSIDMSRATPAFQSGPKLVIVRLSMLPLPIRETSVSCGICVHL